MTTKKDFSVAEQSVAANQNSSESAEPGVIQEHSHGARDSSVALNSIRAQQNPIEVLVLDITLPGTPSREIFEEARRLRPEMRTIVTSAYSKDMAAASLGGRCESFIRKPYRCRDLVDLIRQTLS